MTDIYEQIGEKIRELRTSHRGRGMSQEELSKAVGTTANTISRWETAAYKPSVEDLENLSRFFGVPISVFFRNIEPASKAQALLSATGDLDEDDLEELTRYALFRKARKELRNTKRGRKGK
jgi:transcriptional regulator with XRE-family HTH domain